ncbi:MAG: histidine kinase [Saprospiraceae bacterium]|nr:histidine kinase [Saprospiraceae bacterium]
MKLISENKVHLLGIAILCLVNITGNPLPDSSRVEQGLIAWTLLMLLVIFQWMGIVTIVRFSWRKYRSLSQVNKRLIYSFLISLLWVIPLMVLADYVTISVLQNQAYGGWLNKAPFYLFNSVILSFTAIGATEAVYYYNKLRLAEKEKDELRRINLHTQYDSLKQQVNPHFLFNSLNTLASLISIDPDRAEKFVEEMSQVYRYLLHSNQEELVPLSQELKFIHSYLHLLQTRYGDSLKVDMLIPSNFYLYRLPPLTLQLLVENAVKHNEISTLNPLRIKIFIEEGRMIVSNNLQRKALNLPSAKIGLANIMAKYRLLDNNSAEVLETENEFIVKLPLVK